MRIAYLVNQYPAVSHSFIRREIAGVEAAGYEVMRFSIRLAGASLPDARDRAEAELTTTILAQSTVSLIFAFLFTLVERPRALMRALRTSRRMTVGKRHRLVPTMAYVVEACWLARALKRAGVSHIHAHFGTNPAAVARLTSFMSDIPYSFTVHGPDEFDAPDSLDLAGKAIDASFTVAISCYGQSQLMRWLPVKHWSRLAVVRCGVDPEGWVAKPDADPGAKFCCVARLSAQKGLPILIDAVALLRDRSIDVHVTVVGDGELHQDLVRQIDERNVADRIALVGMLGGADVVRQIQSSRAMVLPSFAEGLPVVLMEAFAAGTPVITTKIAGIPELVDESCGWLVVPGSAASLADAMAAAIATPFNILSEMAGEGRRRVAEHHDAKKNALQIVRLIETKDARAA